MTKKTKDIFEELVGDKPENGYEFTSVEVYIGHRAICVNWSAKGIGFGGVDFVYDEDNGLEVHKECMSREFVAALYDYLKIQQKTKTLIIKEMTEDGEDSRDLVQVNPNFIMASLYVFIKFGVYDPR